MSALRLLRTKRQRQFLVAYLTWVITLFAVYWWEPYAVSERWGSYVWFVAVPPLLFALFYVRDIVAATADVYRTVSGWVNRGED